MKVLTLNTHAWMEEYPEEKLEQIADFIAQEGFEMIALQEINQTMDSNEVTDDLFIKPSGETHSVAIKEDNFAYLLVRLLKKRGQTYYWSWTANHIGYDKYDEGVAILSKTPFSSESILVSDSTDYACHLTRRILKGHISVDNQEWAVFSCHYSWWLGPEDDLLFKKEWDETLRHIDPDSDTIHLLMGDFNNEAEVQEEGYAYMQKTAPQILDTYVEAEEKIGSATVLDDIDGWEGDTNEKRIDYIFTDYTGDIKSSRVVFDGQREPIVSDHFGVVVEF